MASWDLVITHLCEGSESLVPIPTFELLIFRTSFDQMPLLDLQFLNSYREQRLAHLVLSSITMGYVWQEGETQPAEVRGKETPGL